MRRSLFVAVALCVLACCAFGQTETPLPTVTAFECPKYPPKAESMRLQGMVKLKVTTDGHQITDVKLLPSHPVLAEEAVKNVRTWRFADHKPTSFIVTFYYVDEGHYKKDPVTKCSAKMELPAKVTVSTSF
jgi:TonB family protein